MGEGSSITESQPTTGNLDLQAKKLGVFVKLNNELLRFASPSAEGLVRLDMARAAALKADLAMAVPGDDAKVAVDYVERNRQCIEHRFCELAVLRLRLRDRIVYRGFVMG